MKRDWTLVCDRPSSGDGALRRVGLFQGLRLLDLYYEKRDRPDLSGAVVTGKLLRARAGGQAGWFDAGLSQKLYVEAKEPLRAGDYVALRIQTTLTGDKAWPASLCADVPPGAALGLLFPPPSGWERALTPTARARLGGIAFASSEDADLFARQEAANPAWLERLEKADVAAFTARLDEAEEALSQPVVPLPSGGSLVIESTEALVAIDVNAGENANPLAANILAAREAARQIRLRQLGGIIIMDALKMAGRTDRDKFLTALKDSVADDPAGVQVFGLTKLGLVEMTRRRLGPPLSAFLADR